ncbi:MAG: nucleotide sugar dehydrogenase [bacterium]|nr:nucleotide sugar dehydrogenase [bacterium]
MSDSDRTAASLEQLLDRVERRQTTVGVIGLGYVGLPLALAFHESGFPVLGFDIDSGKVDQLAAGGCYIDHLDGARVARAVASGGLAVTCDFERLSEADALLICVPTPLDRHREPDLSYVEATARQIGRRLRLGQLIVLESTTYPGTTEELLLPILAASGLECGREFFLAFSPEREDPGNRDFAATVIPKVVGGADEASSRLTAALYRDVFQQVVPVSSTRAAEATKLTENIFRSVNIALVNELKTVYEAMGIDVWEVLDAAATKPFGFMKFTPGPGWGGHCIPVDPFYLSWKAREYGLRARFIELAGEVNVEMPRYVLGKLQDALNDRGKAVRGSRVLILGLAYKSDVADPRESPAFEIIARLVELGAAVSYHDPLIPEAPAMRTWPDLPAMKSVELGEQTLERQDAVIIVTRHSAVDYALLAAHAALIVDTRGVYRQPAANVVRA